jgi:phenylalanyl-tRNA synthetase alpha chain
VRVAYAGQRSGLLRDLAAALRDLPPPDKREYGRRLNELKTEIQEALAAAQTAAAATGVPGAAVRAAGAEVDVTLPGRRPPVGAQHPVQLVRRRVESIFLRMGYDVEDGPEVEDDWHNFEALNIPPDHPARDDQDTFYLPGGMLLRTHTSPVQARVMERRQPPIRIIVPGRVYRRDSDLRHSPMFHQVEGLLVDEGITFGHLKATLETFLRALFSEEVAVRLRPVLPFTERRPRSTSAASSAARPGAASARARGGSRSWARAWSTRGSSRRSASTPSATPGSPSGSGSTASPCWSTASPTCARCSKATSA